MAPPPGKEFPRLRADAAFKKLSPAHQEVLLEFCRTGKPFTPEVREGDAILLCDSLGASRRSCARRSFRR